MEEEIKQIVKRFELVGELASLRGVRGYKYLFDEKVSVFHYNDDESEVKFDEVTLDKKYISFPAEMTAKGLESICIEFEKLIDKHVSIDMSEELKKLRMLKDQRKALDAKIAGMRKGTNET